jgi:hypothetical protein
MPDSHNVLRKTGQGALRHSPTKPPDPGNAFADILQTQAFFGKASKFKLCLILLVSAEGMPFSCNFNILNCETLLKCGYWG